MATITWTGAQYGNWATATNWSSATVPGAGDDVAIATNSPVVSGNVGTVNSISTTGYGTSLYLLGGTLAVTGDLKSASGGLYVDAFLPGGGYPPGGSNLSIGGTLSVATNYVVIGNTGLTTPTRVSVGHLQNGYTLSVTGSTTAQAQLYVADAAGFGTAGTLTGGVNLTNDALLDFASGTITAIGTAGSNGNYLDISGPNAFLATGAATTSNSALAGLQTIYGGLTLKNGAALALGGNLTNSGTIDLDNSNASDGTQFQDGGSTLSVAGTLTNATPYYGLYIGGTNLKTAVTATLGGLVNTGNVSLTGTQAGRATLTVQGAAGFGTAGTLTGRVSLYGNAAFTFGSGTLTSIAAGSFLTLDDADLSLSPAFQGLTDNAGTFTVTGVSASFGAFSNEGTINIGNDQAAAAAVSFTGVFTNNDSLSLGDGYDGAGTTVNAGGLVNSPNFLPGTGIRATISVTGTMTQQSLIVGAPAGFGTAGVVTGVVTLNGSKALLQFASGALTDIAAGASLGLSGGATIADAGATGSDSALDLSSVAGTLTLSGEALASSGNLVDLAGSTITLSGGSSLSVAGALTSEGNLTLADGHALSVGGRLTTSGTFSLTDDGTTAATVTAASLANGGTMSIRAGGAPGSQATAAVTVAGDASNSGNLSIGFYPSAGAALNVGGALTNTGTVEMEDTATVTAASFAQSAGGTLQFDASPTAAVDTFAIAGGASLDGTLQVGALQGATAGQTFTFATFAAGRLSGLFHSVGNFSQNTSGSRLDLGNGSTLGIAYNASAGTVTGTVYATPSSYADTFVGAIGDFNTATNWSNGAPLSYSDVDIGKTVPARVTLGADATVNSLLLENGSELDATGSASLFIGTDGDTTILANAVLNTSGSSGSLNIAGNLAIDSGTVTTASGVIEGNLNNAGTLEVKSGTLTVEGLVNGAGRIIVDAGATLKVGSTQISNAITDNGTIEVSNGTVNFNTDIAGTGAVLADSGATADITGRGPSTLGFNGVGGILQLDKPIAVTGAFSGLQPGDSIDFGGFAATSVVLTSQNTLRVADAKNDVLTYALTGSAPAAVPFALYADGYGDTLATLTAVPSSAYNGDGGQDNPPALGVVYDSASGGQGVLTRNGLNWTLAFAAASGQAASPFHIVAVNRDGTDPIDATFNLVTGGGTGSDVTLLGGGNAAVSGVKPGGYTLADGTAGYGPHVQVSIGTPTKFEVDSATTNGATTFPPETLTILYGLSPIGNDDGGIDPTSTSTSGPMPPPTSPPPPVNPSPIILPGNGGGGHATGDVHYLTFDGVAYDLQQAGEFVLARSTQSGDDFQVQIRTQPYNNSGNAVSVTTQVAIALGTDHVTFGIGRASELMVDGAGVTLSAAKPVDTLSGGTVTLTVPDTYEIKAAGGETVDLTVGANIINTTAVTLGRFGGVVGLLGTDSGLASRDFQTADGTILTTPISQSDLASFGNGWRITDAASLLDYAPGQNTETFQNLSYPAAPVTLADLPASVVATATAMAVAAGITDPTLQANAALDYALTNDASLVADTLTLQQEGATASYTLAPTQGAAAPTGIGVLAPNTVVAANASGATAVTFTAYATAPVSANTVVNYAGIAAGPGYLNAADFGGAFPQGSVTIASGSSSASFTVSVPNGALGALASDKLRLAISDPASGLPIYTGTADVTVASASPVAGTAAAPAVVDLTNQGTLSGSGQAYTLDFGSVAQGASIFAGLGIANTAAVGANTLGGTFDVGPGAYFVSGVASFSGIAGQGTEAGLNIVADTSQVGANSETITLHPAQSNPSGFSGTLADLTLTITDTVVGKAPVAPTITGTVANQQTASEAAVKPFSGVTVGDVNAGATDTLTITLSGAGGSLTGAGSAANGVYTLTGISTAVTSQLDALVFIPSKGQPGTSATTGFALSDASSASTTMATDSVTSVVNTDPPVAPTITGTVANQHTAPGASVLPFSGVTVGDGNAGASDSLTITVGGAGGTLSGSGLGGGANGVYTVSGGANAITGQLDSLRFTPNGIGTSTLALSLKSSAFAMPATDNTTSVVDSATAAPVVTITMPAAGSRVSVIDPTIAGTVDTADAGSTVTVTSGTSVLGTATVAANGTWSIRPTFAGDGSYTITASDTNPGGTGTATDTFTIDPTPNKPLFGSTTTDVKSTAGQIYALYETILGRAPDPTGFESFVASANAGTPLTTIAQSFIGSAEYAADYGSSTQTSSAFVAQLYQDGLHRAPDANGGACWTAQIDSGSLTRSQVAASIAASAESQQDLAPTFQQGVFVPDSSDSAVARLYYGLLNRAPDAAGLQNSENNVKGGTTLAQLAQSFLLGPEYQATAPGQAIAGYVNGLYQSALGRQADAGGLANFTGQLERGSSYANVADAILTSSEFQRDEAGQSNSSYIDAVYVSALGRHADASGQQTWNAALNGGESRAQVAQGIVASKEFMTNVEATHQATFVNAIYEGVFGRAASASELQGAQTALNGGSTPAAVAVTASSTAAVQLAPGIEGGFHIA